MVDALNDEQKKVIDDARVEALKNAEAEFAKLDKNGDGTVEKDELVAYAKTQASSGEKLTEAQKAEAEAQIDAMIAQFDSNADGKVQKQEWLDFFTKVFDDAIVKSLQ